MKTLRNKNIKPVKHKSNKNRRRHTHKNRKPKKRTTIRKRKGGFWKPDFLKTTAEMRAKSGHQAPILELFQQIHKTYITWPGSKDHAKHKFHMAKLDAAVNKLHCDIIQELIYIYEHFLVDNPAVYTIVEMDNSGKWVKRELETPWHRMMEGGDRDSAINRSSLQVEKWDKSKETPSKEEQIKTPSKEEQDEQQEEPEDDEPPKEEIAKNLLKSYTDYLINLDQKFTKDFFPPQAEEREPFESTEEEIAEKKKNRDEDKEFHVKLLITYFHQQYMTGQNAKKNKANCEKKDTVLDPSLQKNLTINNQQKMWLFTRHGPSCNNIVTSNDEWIKTMEPNLADGGIKRLIKFKLDNTDNRFNSKYVFVSSLVRTWMTAIILYGINLENETNRDTIVAHHDIPNVKEEHTLHLCIAPFLKEHYQWGFQSGNFQISIPDQIEKIQSFLTFLKSQLEEGVTIVSKIELQLPNGDNTLKTITINTSDGVVRNYDYKIADFYGLSNRSIRNAALFGKLLKPGKDSQIKQLFYHHINYAYNGEFGEFIAWVNKYNNILTNYVNQDTIHIIGHSNLMQSGLKRLDAERGDQTQQRYFTGAKQKGILKTNAWSLKIKNSDINDVEIFKGIVKEDSDDPTWEKSRMCNSKLSSKTPP